MATHYLLELYEDDDTTVLTSFSTDPAHARPWLVVEDYGSEAEIDFLEGSATIGEVRVRIVDPQTGATQADRGFTALLADAAGVAQIGGHRVTLQEVVDGTPGRMLKDGVAGDVVLADNEAEFSLAVRDIRERERTTPAFTESGFDTTLPATARILRLFPYGPDGGYGRRFPGDSPQIPDRRPTALGRIAIKSSDGTEALWRAVNTKRWHGYTDEADAHIRAMFAPVPVYDAAGAQTGTALSRVVVRWRLAGASTWTVLRDMPQGTKIGWRGWSKYLDLDEFPAFSLNSADPDDLPAKDALVELQVYPASQPVSDENPLYIEAPWGTLVADLYDGAYSPYDPRLRYDTTAVAGVGTGSGAPLARVKVTQPADDLKTWLEEHVYAPLGYAPALGADGTIRPVSDALPTATTPILYLTDANTVRATWAQRVGEVINTVRMTAVTEIIGRAEGSGADANAFATEEVETPVQFTTIASAGLFGERDLNLSGLAFRGFTTDSGTGSVAQSGTAVATAVTRRRHETLRDRRAFGAYAVEATCLRTDVDVEAAQVGDSVVIGDVALPEFATGKRGGNRLMQIVRRQDVSGVETVFSLSDAGPSAVPVPAPTIDNATDAGDGKASVQVTAAPSAVPNARVYVEYAVADTAPTGNAQWMVGGRIEADATLPATITTPFVGEGTVWFRARSEAPGRVLSAWTSLESVTIGVAPALTAVSLVWDADADDTHRFTLSWAANAPTAGLLVEWAAYVAGDDAPTSYTGSATLEADALLDYEIPATLIAGQALAVRVTPRAGYTGGTGGVGGTLSGATGEAVVRTADVPLGETDPLIAEAAARALLGLAPDGRPVQPTHVGLVESFPTPLSVTMWQNAAGTGTVSFIPADGVVGPGAMLAQGETWRVLASELAQPYDPSLLYRMRVWYLVDSYGGAAGPPELFAGIAGFDANGVLVNHDGDAVYNNQHWVCSSGEAIPFGANGGGFVMREGWFRGLGTAPVNERSANPATPRPVHPDVRTFVPLLALNLGMPSGAQVLVDAVIIEAYDADAAIRLYGALDASGNLRPTVRMSDGLVPHQIRHGLYEVFAEHGEMVEFPFDYTSPPKITGYFDRMPLSGFDTLTWVVPFTDPPVPTTYDPGQPVVPLIGTLVSFIGGFQAAAALMQTGGSAAMHTHTLSPSSASGVDGTIAATLTNAPAATGDYSVAFNLTVETTSGNGTDELSDADAYAVVTIVVETVDGTTDLPTEQKRLSFATGGAYATPGMEHEMTWPNQIVGFTVPDLTNDDMVQVRIADIYGKYGPTTATITPVTNGVQYMTDAGTRISILTTSRKARYEIEAPPT